MVRQVRVHLLLFFWVLVVCVKKKLFVQSATTTSNIKKHNFIDHHNVGAFFPRLILAKKTMLRLVRRATTLSQKHKQQQRYMSTAANLLRFDYSAEQLAQETNNLIAKEQKLLDQVGAFAAEQCTFDSVVKPLALSEALFSTLSSNVTFPGYVSTDKGVRDASSEAQKKIEVCVLKYVNKCLGI